jgi:hypothetical protein
MRTAKSKCSQAPLVLKAGVDQGVLDAIAGRQRPRNLPRAQAVALDRVEQTQAIIYGIQSKASFVV